MVNNNRVVRLPMHDPKTNDLLPGYLEVDVEFFISSTRGLRSNQARIVEFQDTAYPDPTPEQEVEIMDRIISGLPIEYLKPSNPDGIHTYSKIPEVELPVDRTPFIVEEYMEDMGEKLTLANTWKRIPEFDNYEVSPLGVIRNRWTKRVLDQTLSGSFLYVDMHDKDGNPHLISVEHIVTSVFS